MNAYLNILDELEEFNELVKELKENKTPVNVLGVSDSVKAHLVCCACEKLNTGALIVTDSEENAKKLCSDLQCFSDRKVVFFPRVDLLFYDVEAKGQDITRARLKALRTLAEEPDKVIAVTTAEALAGVTAPVNMFCSWTQEFEEGADIDLEGAVDALLRMGYSRESMAEGEGQFSLRGGILDIYPCSGETENPVRIELFDTEVDSIRLFDAESQRTVDKIKKIKIYPAKELILSEAQRTELIKKLKHMFGGLGEDERSVRASQGLKRDTERLEQGMLFPSLDKYIPYIYDKKPCLLDYIPDDSLIFWDEPVRIKDAIQGAAERREEEVCDLAERGVLCEANADYSVPYGELVSRIAKRRFVGMSGISHGSSDYRPVRTHSFTVKSLNGFQGKLEFLIDAVRFYKRSIYRTVIMAGSKVRAENLAKRLEDDGIRCSCQSELTELPSPGGVVVTCGSIQRGFEYPLIRIAVIGDKEIFGEERKKRPRYKQKRGEKISDFTDLKPGDYIVHQNHGIGLYTGIEQLNVDGVKKDYLKLQYRGTDILYVPTDQLDMVYKHSAKEGVHVKLNKLGGTEWSATKQRVKAGAADMAKELIALYAKRSEIKGIAFQKDSEWQKDFEAAFPYEETSDQLRSIDEVKADMEKPHPMDRLLCGDVGYGKTEVAMRAAFKAVMSGFQVAYLVPTTVLASQHYNNFKQRMMNYPMRIEMLSRFTTGAQKKGVLKGIETGEVDIVIGTHKLLGKDVKFSKLGLLVIDEEQRFGVAHKEKLKEIRKEVDVLTLSATPIPRTLHMSLSGIRDMSVINEPPGERYPVATYVMEYDENVVRDAILRETGRGGQVYYLYNRVEGIYKVANRLAEAVPDARVAVAHGQMHERELEEIMLEVSEGEIDVLVCTTIIETGLDIPNVNTIIIENSDRLGLAQLYQLRGRVGRSSRLAYAYLTFRRNKVLTEEAEKRLLAIKEFTEFGSGFKIAMRDLEIRGTGNLIGAQQHGHMEAVGYEMYCRLLEQAVREQKGETEEIKTETMIDLPVSAYIPEAYITNHSQRISAYKRIAAIDSQEELYDAYDEIEDRYGTVPQTVYNLMETALIKGLAQKCGIAEIIGSSSQVIFKFDENNMPPMQPLVKLVSSRPKELFLPGADKPKLHYKLPKPTEKGETEYFKAICEVVEQFEAEE